MKTFKELEQELENRNDLQESRLLRKGVLLVFARNAKKHGDDAVRHFKSAQKNFRKKTSFDPKEKSLISGLIDLSKGLTVLVKQNNSLAAISLKTAFMNDKLNLKIHSLKEEKLKARAVYGKYFRH